MSQYPDQPQQNGNVPPQYQGGNGAPQYQGGNGTPQYQGGSPAYPQGGAPGADLSVQPKSVRTGILLLWISVAISLVLGIIAALTADVTAQLQGPGVTDQDVEALASATRITAIVFVVIMVAVEALFIWFASKGRNWARIVLAVFAAFSVIGIVVSLFGGGILNIIGSILFVVGVVMLFRKDATAWYQAHTAAKHAY